MKKLISILLALLLIVGLLPTAVFAKTVETFDTIRFEQVASKTSENGHFTVSATDFGQYGWLGGMGATLTVAATDGLIISRIEAVIGSYEDDYDTVNIVGTAQKQPIINENGVKKASITNINSKEFSIAGGNSYLRLKDITVYYMVEVENSTIIPFEQVKNKKSADGNFELTTNYVGKNGWYGGQGYSLTITAADGLTITRIEAVIGNFSWFYDDILVSGTAQKQPIINENGVEKASITNINSKEFSIPKGGNTINLKDITVFYTGEPTNPTGSVLSQGNIWIVSGVAVVAAGTVAALVITKKKKSAAANTEK